jgi:FKBP-type peptidyl-prolyl cis-trans isomerase
MRSSTRPHRSWLACIALLACVACGRGEADLADAEAPAFTPYVVADSSLIRRFPSGLQLYVVEPGVGDYPLTGTSVRMHYQGRLQDGTVFDDSYARAKEMRFIVGEREVIPGIEEAVRNLRLGSKAVAVIPPNIGYGDGTEQKLPPKIPANATLTFDLHVLGSF